MAKQSFTVGQVLTAAQMSDLQQTAMTGGAASTKTVSYVLVAADAGTRIAMNAVGSTTITVNTGLFSAGDTVSIQNIGAGVCTITAGTATVNTAGSLVLAQYQGGILYFTSASAAIFFQFATPASSGDIEGVTAGVGISGGGTSGTVTVTNSMATAIDAKGDLVVGTGADTFSRLAVGANDTVLTAASGEATGLKWATVSGGGYTSLASGTLGNSTTLSSISGSYRNLVLILRNCRPGTDGEGFRLRLNGNTGSVYVSDVAYSQATYTFTGTFMQITSGIDNTATNGFTQVTLFDYANSASTFKFAETFSIQNNPTTSTSANTYNMASISNITANINELTIYVSSGTTAAGTYELYGVK